MLQGQRRSSLRASDPSDRPGRACPSIRRSPLRMRRSRSKTYFRPYRFRTILPEPVVAVEHRTEGRRPGVPFAPFKKLGRPKGRPIREQRKLRLLLLVVEIRQTQRFLVLRPEQVLEVRLRGRLVLLEEDLAIGGHARAGRDESADDDVLLEAAQVVDSAGDSRF